MINLSFTFGGVFKKQTKNKKKFKPVVDKVNSQIRILFIETCKNINNNNIFLQIKFRQ